MSFGDENKDIYTKVIRVTSFVAVLLYLILIPLQFNVITTKRKEVVCLKRIMF
jgi:hypothetical protein